MLGKITFFVKMTQQHGLDFWNNVLWTNENKVEMFDHDGQHYVWGYQNTAYENKQLVPIVEHSSGGVMTWAYFAGTGP